MLPLGKVCEQPLLSLTRICENGKWKMENYLPNSRVTKTLPVKRYGHYKVLGIKKDTREKVWALQRLGY